MSEKKEYIERGALIEKLKEKITTNYLNLYDEDTLESIIRFAEKQPAADVEPVVRCKKCRYWEVIGTDEDEGFCKFRAGYIGESYYCADGKERER